MRATPAAILVVLLAGCRGASPDGRHGGLDVSFGTDGRVVRDIATGQDSANAVLIEPSGHILVGGQAQDTLLAFENNLGLMRFYPDGAPDVTFGGGAGMVTTDLGSQEDEVLALAELHDGSIRAAGLVTSNGEAFLSIAGYDATGVRDPFFADNGILATGFRTSLDGVSHPLALQPDGRLLLAGNVRTSPSTESFAVARFLASGRRDKTFGVNGQVTTSIEGHDSPYAVAVAPDGRIVVTGGVGSMKMACYLSDGTLDVAFGTGGSLIRNYLGSLETGRALAIQPDGKILVLVTDNNGGKVDVILARFHADGTEDLAFGSPEGNVQFEFATQFVGATDIALQDDGRIVVTGTHYDGADYSFELARFESDGTPDLSFGDAGRVITPFDSSAYGVSVALQSDGRILVAGSAQGDFGKDFAVARYLP